jgi:hypothetical protein
MRFIVFCDATQTASPIKTARAIIAVTSAFSPVITARASVQTGSDLSSAFTVTAILGAIKQFTNIINVGIRTGSPYLGLQVTPASGVRARFTNYTLSIWVRRDSSNNSPQPIVSTRNENADNDGAFVFVGDNIQTRFNYNPAQGEAVWTNVAPSDGLWHHYLIRTVNDANAGDGVARHWRLWIDGVAKGQTAGNGYQAAGQMTWNDSYGGSAEYQGVSLGNGNVANFSSGYDVTARTLDGAVAQLWMGQISDAAFNITDFYDGYLDFGSDGTRQGRLPTPLIYTPLAPSYTDLGVGVTAIRSVPSWAGDYLKYSSTTAVARFSAQPTTVLLILASLSSAATVTVTATRIQTTTASISSVTTVTITAQKIVSITKALLSAVTVTAQGDKIRFGVANLASAATVTVTGGKVTPMASQVTSAFTVQATAKRTARTTTAVTARFTVTAAIDDRTRSAISLEAGAFTFTASATRTRTVNASISSAVTVSCSPNKIRSMASQMSSAFTATASARKVIVNSANFTAQFTIFSIVYRAIIGQASLSANGFVLTQGDILNFDPCREIAVDQETRLARILPENRLLIVDSETRRLKVPQETRVLKVDYETRVNITQC